MFDLCTHDLSQAFWKRMIHLNGWRADSARRALEQIGSACEITRPTMDYQTGSIPFSTALWLFMLSRQVCPNVTIEVGTFIAKSTLAMVAGHAQGKVYTCDASNGAPDFSTSNLVDPRLLSQIKFHPRMTSAEMLATRMPDDLKADMVFYDGRVGAEDMALLAKHTHENTVFAFDDFEGTEKGVANVAAMRRPDLALIQPPTIQPHPLVNDRSTLALLVPVGLFRFTAQ